MLMMCFGDMPWPLPQYLRIHFIADGRTVHPARGWSRVCRPKRTRAPIQSSTGIGVAQARELEHGFRASAKIAPVEIDDRDLGFA